jgi:hypothetical protein
MSQFSLELERVMGERELTAVELERRSSVDNGKIGRILRGQLAIRPHDLTALVKHAGRNDEERAHLIAAYMRDWCIGDPKATRLIEVRVDGKKTTSAVEIPKLPERITWAVTVLMRELPTNPKVQRSLVSLAEFLEP